MNIETIEDAADIICKSIERALQRKEGLLIGRNGTIELETVFHRLYMSRPNAEYPVHIKNRIELHAGVWPNTKVSIDKWVFTLVEAIRLSDIIVAGWYEPLKQLETDFLNGVNKNSSRIPLRALEPYYVSPEKRWTSLLKGHKVAIVNSFTETALKQIKNRELIWPVATDSLLPEDVEWIPIRTGYAPALAKGHAEWASDIQSWDVAVTDTVRRVMESGATFALVGCGGLGMLIGAELRKRGKIVIVMGGALQVLFGIKGSRWKTHNIIQHFWNDSWVYPSESETPGGANQIEGACYWQKN